MKKIIFVSNNWADAHQQVRLQALLKLCPALVCLTFIRNYYPATTSVKPLWKGEMEHASYLKRWSVYLQFLKQLHKVSGSGDIVYMYGFDLAVVTFLFRVLSRRHLKLVYEVPDIREMFFRQGPLGTLLRWIESIVIPRLDLLVVTSPEFLTEYYQKLRGLRTPEYLVIENKVHRSALQVPVVPVSEQPSEQGRIRIGYFGLLRCKVALDCLILLARTGKFEIVLRGIFMPDTRQYESKVKDWENISYNGPYDATTKLDALYSAVDIVWAAYPYSSQSTTGNHLWARTNRFYESLYFQKPLIVQQGTCDAKRAFKLGRIAIEVDLKDVKMAAEVLQQQLTPDNLTQHKKALSAIPEHEYIITDEYQRLAHCLLLRR